MRLSLIATLLLTSTLLTSTLLTSACATMAPGSFDVTPIQSNGQSLSGLDEATILESRHPGGIVSVRIDQRFSELGVAFLIAAQNKGAAPIEFGPQNIGASVNGRPAAVLAAAELERRVMERTRGFLRATSRSDRVDVVNASEEFNREYRFNNYGGCPAGQSGCQVYGADNGAGYRQDRIDRQRDADNLGQVATALQADLALISQRALAPSPVAPEQMTGGLIVVEPPANGGLIELVVTVNGQRHQFAFTAAPGA